MKLSVPGLKLIEAFEGLRLKAYRDVAGIPTIGFGHIDGVKMDDICTFEQAENWLKEDVGIAESCVKLLVKVPIAQNSFDALVSFAYNCGCGNLQNSTLLKLLNAGEFQQAADEFLKWNKVNKKEVAGLTARRTAERLLFLGDEGEN